MSTLGDLTDKFERALTIQEEAKVKADDANRAKSVADTALDVAVNNVREAQNAIQMALSNATSSLPGDSPRSTIV